MIRHYLYTVYIVISATVTHSGILFDTTHLPLVNWVQKTFPEVKTKYFIIANPQIGIIIHEQNSNIKLRCGSFSNIVLSAALLEKYGQKLRYIAERNLNRYTGTRNNLINTFLIKFEKLQSNSTDIAAYNKGELLSLYDMCNIFNYSYKDLSVKTDIIKYGNNISYIFFNSEQNGFSCAFRYINTNKCIFDCIIFGVRGKSELLSDINNVCVWLDKFLIQNLPSKYKATTNIPVFYGRQHKLHVILQEPQQILMIRNKPEQITRTVKYLMRIKAPVSPMDKVGWVFYKTSLFENPIRKTIFAGSIIKKGNIFSNLLDSIYYIIYNKPYST